MQQEVYPQHVIGQVTFKSGISLERRSNHEVDLSMSPGLLRTGNQGRGRGDTRYPFYAGQLTDPGGPDVPYTPHALAPPPFTNLFMGIRKKNRLGKTYNAKFRVVEKLLICHVRGYY